MKTNDMHRWCNDGSCSNPEKPADTALVAAVGLQPVFDLFDLSIVN
jgi:hypothetical protein